VTRFAYSRCVRGCVIYSITAGRGTRPASSCSSAAHSSSVSVCPECLESIPRSASVAVRYAGNFGVCTMVWYFLSLLGGVQRIVALTCAIALRMSCSRACRRCPCAAQCAHSTCRDVARARSHCGCQQPHPPSELALPPATPHPCCSVSWSARFFYFSPCSTPLISPTRVPCTSTSLCRSCRGLIPPSSTGLSSFRRSHCRIPVRCRTSRHTPLCALPPLLPCAPPSGTPPSSCTIHCLLARFASRYSPLSLRSPVSSCTYTHGRWCSCCARSLAMERLSYSSVR
jgi:hypothetical protein